MQISILIRLNYVPKKFEKQDLAVAKARVVAVYGILGSGEQTRIESCIIRIPESMVESQQSSPN
jgi:hypothetical protein